MVIAARRHTYHAHPEDAGRRTIRPHLVDGHAKNFSLFMRPGGRYQPTPLCDVLSAYPLLGEGPSKISPHWAKLAMGVRNKNVHWNMKDIFRRQWLELGKRLSVVTDDGRPAQAVLDDLMARTPEVLANFLQQLQPSFSAAVADSSLAGVEGAAARLAA